LLKRILNVTGGLVLVGAATGALAGLIALLPLPLEEVVRPTRDNGMLPFLEMAPFAAAVGAALGAVLGPALAWSILRHVALWRVIVHPLVGTIFGTAIGWALASNPWLPGIPAILGFGLLGTVAGAIQLRIQVRRTLKATHIADAT
jgi:hypothetical protein